MDLSKITLMEGGPAGVAPFPPGELDSLTQMQMNAMNPYLSTENDPYHTNPLAHPPQDKQLAQNRNAAPIMAETSQEMDHRLQLITHRDYRWTEIRKYSEYIRRFAYSESSQADITKDNYYDLYNMAVGLIKSIDALDPDKVHIQSMTTRKPTEIIISPSTASVVQQAQAPSQDGYFNPYEYYYARGYLNYGADPSQVVMYESPSNNSKKRARKANSSKRNLQCSACGVTKTPEWRRGPQGDHTLCNACGLQYAKSIKKTKEKPEGSPSEKKALEEASAATIAAQSMLSTVEGHAS
eukprot:TRINITY_DN1672_c1_g1_i1.p1 TRINITY_DN1672_c1_g1~~TRINITY_DN1672_c1_g1_i1.p1  ORF type:complete len:296 (+),score=56.08 TRINITY_DN1672_c1_g1_i1:150-1037(+)